MQDLTAWHQAVTVVTTTAMTYASQGIVPADVVEEAIMFYDALTPERAARSFRLAMVKMLWASTEQLYGGPDTEVDSARARAIASAVASDPALVRVLMTALLEPTLPQFVKAMEYPTHGTPESSPVIIAATLLVAPRAVAAAFGEGASAAASWRVLGEMAAVAGF